MSMSYQLEVLWYQVWSLNSYSPQDVNMLRVSQAERLRSLGWGEFLKVEMSRDRKTLSVSYWM